VFSKVTVGLRKLLLLPYLSTNKSFVYDDARIKTAGLQMLAGGHLTVKACSETLTDSDKTKATCCSCIKAPLPF
jgi:hypothetical protein